MVKGRGNNHQLFTTGGFTNLVSFSSARRWKPNVQTFAFFKRLIVISYGLRKFGRDCSPPNGFFIQFLV